MHKALSNILQQYLRQETLVTGENGGVDEELLESLHKCLEEKGVLKDVHAFLRKRLVAVLKGTWPQLFDHFRSDRDLNPIVLKLIEDFLCSHKLLFTLSILTTELGDAFCPKVGFGKLSSLDAEALLFNLGVRPDTVPSQKILENYASTKGNKSLFECIISFCPAGIFGSTAYTGPVVSKEVPEQGQGQKEIRSQLLKNILTLDERLKKVDDKFHRSQQQQHPSKKNTNLKRVENMSVDERFRHFALDLERDKQIQLQIAIDKFKSEEISRIKEEIETDQKFELLRKEKELLANYEEKVIHLKNNLEREKEVWMIEKTQREREILDKREELLEAIQSAHEKRNEQKRFSEVSTQTIDTAEGLVQVEANDASGVKVSEIDSMFLFAKTPEQRDMERTYLLREAKLKLTIEKLQREIQCLRKAPSPTKSRKTISRNKAKDEESSRVSESDSYSQDRPLRRRTMIRESVLSKSRPIESEVSPNRNFKQRSDRSRNIYRSETSRKDNWTNHFTSPAAADNTDTVAFLQYQLECHSDEIEKLRKAMEQSKQAKLPPVVPKATFQKPTARHIPVPSPPQIPQCLESSDVDGFLREAKQRISDIEKEATLVEQTLKRIHSSDPLTSNGSSLLPDFLEKKFLSFKPPPPRPEIPELLLQRLNSLQEQFSRPRNLQVPIRRIPDIPSVPAIEKTVSFDRLDSDPEFEALCLRYRQFLDSQVPQAPAVSRNTSRRHNLFPEEHDASLLQKNCSDKMIEVADDGTCFRSLPSSPPPARKTASILKKIQEDDVETSSPSSISYLRNERKNDIDKSLDRVAVTSASPQLKTVEKESGGGELSEGLSLHSSATRCGALVKNNVGGTGHGGGGEDDRRHGSSDESLKTSSAGTTLESSSTSVFVPKSLDLQEKAGTGTGTTTKENLEVKGSSVVQGSRSGVEKGFVEDSKSNPINATSNSTFPMFFMPFTNEQKVAPPHKSHLNTKSLAPPPAPPNLFEDLEEELEDLGPIETSEDLAMDENLFWQM